MSATATAGLAAEAVNERIHAVMKSLDPTFDLPDTSEGIETLTHVRTAEDLEQVLSWLSVAMQYSSNTQPGWSTPAPAAAQEAANAWLRVHPLLWRSSYPLRPALVLEHITAGCLAVGAL
jgi:hypothetical protein